MPTLIDRVAAFVAGPNPVYPGPNYGADGDGVFIESLETVDLLQLTGHDRPKQGVEESAKLRTVKTHYPGNSTPSVQILGRADDDFTLEGSWRDDLFGENGHAMAQKIRARTLHAARPLLQISWGSAMVKRGYLKEVVTTTHSERWIDYKLVFEVVNVEEPGIIRSPFPPQETPFDLLALFGAIDDAIDEVTLQATLINNVAHAIL